MIRKRVGYSTVPRAVLLLVLVFLVALALALYISADTSRATGVYHAIVVGIVAAAAAALLAPYVARVQEQEKLRLADEYEEAREFPFTIYRSDDLGELEGRIGPGGAVPYVLRASPEAHERFRRRLRDNRKVLVTGRSGLGKTRECLEFIAALRTELGEEIHILYPKPGFDAPRAKAVPSDFAPRHVILFIDDIDQHSDDRDLVLGQERGFQERLSRTVGWLEYQFELRDWRVLLVAREEPQLADRMLL